MLACAQDLYFKSDSATNEFQKDKRSHLQQIDHHVSNKEKEEQQVWPADVEAAFIQALETIPKLGRRKILVNGKPCGRNELISDFIFRKTSKIRTRKQVSSHIQVLKNTRKGDPHFMRLLTDSVEADEGYVSQPSVKKPKTIRRQEQKMNSVHSADSITSDESSMSSSPSPADFVFDMMCHDQQGTLSMLDIKDPFYEPFFGSSLTDIPSSNENVGGMSASAYSPFSNDVLQQLFNASANDLLVIDNTKQKKQPKKQISKKYTKKQKNSFLRSSSTMPASMNNMILPSSTSNIWIDPSIYPLWPNYICLYLEYSLPYDPSITIPHTLANLPECIPHCLLSVEASMVTKGKCPLLHEVTPIYATTTLSANVKLNLNLNMTEFFFNNTSFFETRDRRTIECTTTIYSFGNVVLESKEVQQALWINEGKYMYSFAYVNQFFDAFMKGIRSLQSWEEVDIAINNLCVVQLFEDIESKFTHNTEADDINLGTESATAPLLLMIYEFERGEGTVDVCTVDTMIPIDFLSSVIVPAPPTNMDI